MNKSRYLWKLAAVAAAAGLALTAGGCRRESPLGSRLFAEAVGIDAAEQAEVTLLGYVADEEAQGDGACIAGDGSTLTEALARITGTTGREPYFPHNGALIVGEATAARGMEGILRFFTGYPGCRAGVPLFVAEGTAAALLRDLQESGDARRLYRLTDAEELAGETVRTPLYTTMTGSGAGDFAAPVLRAAEGGAEVVGTALFRQGKMTGRLTPEETVGLHILRGSLTYALVYLELPEGRAAVAVTAEELDCTVRDGHRQVSGVLRGTLFESEFGVTADRAGGVRASLRTGCLRQLTQWTEDAAAGLARAGSNVCGWTEFAKNLPLDIRLELDIRLDDEK